MHQPCVAFGTVCAIHWGTVFNVNRRNETENCNVCDTFSLSFAQPDPYHTTSHTFADTARLKQHASGTDRLDPAYQAGNLF